MGILNKLKEAVTPDGFRQKIDLRHPASLSSGAIDGVATLTYHKDVPTVVREIEMRLNRVTIRRDAEGSETDRDVIASTTVDGEFPVQPEGKIQFDFRFGPPPGAQQTAGALFGAVHAATVAFDLFIGGDTDVRWEIETQFVADGRELRVTETTRVDIRP